MAKFTIFKNTHYSFPFIAKVKRNQEGKSKRIGYHCVLNGTCEYVIDEKSCVNKLFGLTSGLFNVHNESDRFGWTYNETDDLFHIYAYSYNKGTLYKEEIGSFMPNETFKAELEIKYTHVARIVNFYLNDHCVKTSFLYMNNIPLLSWALSPYFGGNTKAPQKMVIELEKI